ncbi:LuxR family two component transcriptional regulator [Kribbella pratensis]|uniref:LuxR family two component transcriptional regulator n=1 Tax=Kribbella pratensis TaxID=2512112 RepID=A0ABY2F907_9ACTN|nr:response regulator transcription factor [Kribbella pratensis]TDW86968.1 LuxR family two component transcriptional regulator [Kribbella pratensis]
MNTEPRRVVIADDHPMLRAHIRQALETGGFEVCAEAASGPQAVRFAQEHQPDVVLLDIHMPGGGIRAAAELSRLLPELAIVMLTVSRDDNDLFDSLRAGASGYLLKDTDPGRLPEALRGVLSGEAAIPRSLVARILDEFREPGRRRSERRSKAAVLTSREWEVMGLLGDGLTTEEVAKRLYLSPTTIRVHISSVLRKLRVKDRQSAIDLLRDQPF